MDEELVIKAIEIAKQNHENFSFSLLQRKLKVGCIKCSKLIETLEEKGIISPYNAQKSSREVLIK